MQTPKHRLTVSVEPALVSAGQQAVERGEATSVSAWVNDALKDRVRTDEKRRLLAAAIDDYEQEFGQITEAEIEAQQRRDREHAIVVRGSRSTDAARTA